MRKERLKRAGDCLEFSSGVRIIYSQQVIGPQKIYILPLDDLKSLAAVDSPIITPTLVSDRLGSFFSFHFFVKPSGRIGSPCYQTKRLQKKKKKNLPSRKTVKMLLALYKGDHIFCSFYSGECWSGPDDSAFYLEGHAPLEGCADQCINDCAYSTRFCAGKNFTNAVYAISKHYEVARL